MNRTPLLLLLPLLFLACKKDELPDATQAAVKVVVDFNFRAGCIVVAAEDAADATNTARASVEVLGRAATARTVTVAVFRENDWGRELKLTTTAHEQTCDGPVVASDVKQATLDKPGPQTVSVTLSAVDADDDGYVPTANGGTDCDDRDSNVAMRSFYEDGDGDGVGGSTVQRGCTPPSASYVALSGDCDDNDPARWPGNSEICDDKDNDCNNQPDDGLQLTTYYPDGDGDSVGLESGARQSCRPLSGYVVLGGDCDDNDSARWPGNSETCDGKDNNCENGADDGLEFRDYFLDGDKDGVGAGAAVNACAQPINHVLQGGDCNDDDPAIRPGLSETCDDKDNDCQNGVDDGLPTTTFYRDEDGDTYGTSSDSRASCHGTLAGYVTRDGDCNDSAIAVNPAATETCNDVDDNCAGGVDEGFNKEWYRDEDEDGFGVQLTRVTSCQQPAGHVGPTVIFDCNDSDDAVNPAATETCNEVDDNCVGGVDEPFTTGATAKGNSCSTPCPGGTYICRQDGTGTTCDAPQPTDYYTDQDGDGAGAENATAQSFCPGQTVPPNLVSNRNDCDDQDRHNWRTNAEVCDDRDNNCANGVDEDDVCDGTDWALVADSAVTGKNWNTVAVNHGSADGYPVWIAGAGGALARRNSATEPFISFDGQCNTTNWNAAWVRPSDGRVYLTGDGGRVAEFDGTTCTEYPMNGNQHGTGIVGFETGTPATVLLYVADVSGRLHSWTPQGTTNSPQRIEDAGAIYRDVHGFDSSRIFVAGQNSGGGSPPIIRRYTGGNSTAVESIGTFSNNLNIRGVWMGASNFAYAVGDASIVVRWNGGSWVTVTPPGPVDFTSVCAPDPSSGYTTDSAGIIRRYTGSGWVLHHDAGGELRDIALSSPGNVWAVGPAGRVIHFPGR